MKRFRLCLTIFLFMKLCLAVEPVKVNLDPLSELRDDEVLPFSEVVPYLGGRQSPGDSIGITWYDLQSNGSYGQRLFVDASNNVHINWTWAGGPYPPEPRYCAWNFRYSDGTYFGETQASPSISGFVQLDVTRDGTERTIITYHYDPGSGYYSWIDIDSANGAGHWPNDPKTLGISDYIHPNVAVASSNNIIMSTCNWVTNEHQYLDLSTDEGDTWIHIADIDSIGIHNRSSFVRASRNLGSHKVVFVNTRFITDTMIGGFLDRNIWYMVSTDDGVTWSSLINVTDYQPYPFDSARAFNHANIVFDLNDKLHVAWAGRKVTDQYWEASKIFHWDEINDTITIVSSPSIYYPEPGGWWIETATSGDYGGFRLPADQPQLVVDPTNNDLYCLWLGNDDYYDSSAAGYINSEIYGSYSTDNGMTWSIYVNLTNTRSPGAPPGLCMDEDYMTTNPLVVNDSIYVTYIEDKDAGNALDVEGIFTENPVRCWIFHKNLISGIKEKTSLEIGHTAPLLDVYPNPFQDKTEIRYRTQDSSPPHSVRRGQGYMMNDYSLKIYDAAGQLVKDFSRSTLHALRPTLFSWDGTDQANMKLPDGVYFLEFETGDYKETKKLILLR